MPSNSQIVTTKMLGDAGEHFALSQFTFAGRPATKMPDGWKGYDLAVETGRGLARISVKTRSETARWKSGAWFTFNEAIECDWLVFVFRGKNRGVRAWVVPFDTARDNAGVPGENRKDPHIRDVYWSKLNRRPLSLYENNWELEPLGIGAG